MLDEHKVDLYWATFFRIHECDKVAIIKQINVCKAENYKHEGIMYVLDVDSPPFDEIYVKACEIAVLGFCLKDSGFAQDFLSEEDCGKALNQFERKQYKSKLLKELLAKFACLLRIRPHCEGSDDDKSMVSLKLLLWRDIQRTYDALRNEQVEKSFPELKKAMEQIASGVKSECYFSAEKSYMSREKAISDELNAFLVEKYGYNLNGFAWWVVNEDADIYKTALLNNEEFWAKHKNFNVFAFVDSIKVLNDVTRAKKVLTYIFDNIKKDDMGARLLEENLPLSCIYKDRLIDEVEEHLFDMTFDRFSGVYDLSKINNNGVDFGLNETPRPARKIAYGYPLVEYDDTAKDIAFGKDIIYGLFNAVYPSDCDKVIQFINEQLEETENPYRTESEHAASGHSTGGYTVRDLFVAHTFGYWRYGDTSTVYKAVKAFCPEYFSAENMWNRIYIIAYAMSLIQRDRQKCYANLFEVFYDLFKVIEIKFGIKTSFQRDVTGRDNAYAELKQILERYGVNVSDKFKSDYITSLLDRKVAVLEEIDRFPALEQLGDAVYGLAVAEMMFYQPTELEDDCLLKDFDDYVCANAQVEISRKLGLDKLYLSSFSLSYKYTRDVFVKPDLDSFVIEQESASYNNRFAYLADSLEMVIGTVCKDCGYQAAIDFTKRIVKETFPDVFHKEIRWNNKDEIDPEFDVDWEYWNRIMPPPFWSNSFQTYESSTHIEKMWNALNKFMLTYSLGTDNVEVRKYITAHYSVARDGDKLYGKRSLGQHTVNFAIFDYLHNGLAYVVDKYSSVILNNYKKTCK